MNKRDFGRERQLHDEAIARWTSSDHENYSRAAALAALFERLLEVHGDGSRPSEHDKLAAELGTIGASPFMDDHLDRVRLEQIYTRWTGRGLR